MNDYAGKSQRLYYVSTDIIPLAGWVRQHEVGKLIAQMSDRTSIYVATFTEFLAQDYKYYGWVDMEALRVITKDEDNTGFITRFIDLSHGASELRLTIYESDMKYATELYMGIEPNQFYIFPPGLEHSHPFYPNDHRLYVPAGFAQKVIHVVKCAQAQGVDPADVRLTEAGEGEDKRLLVCNLSGRPVQFQPVFWWLKVNG